MDFCQNLTNSGNISSELDQQNLFPSSSSTLDDLFPGNNTEGDINLEWLSIFIEDCLSTTSVNYLPQIQEKSNTIQEPEPAASKPLDTVKPQLGTISSTTSILQKEFVVPGKARTKRSRGTSSNNGRRNISPKFRSWTQHLQSPETDPEPDPPLLQQAYWLADSELIFPKNEENTTNKKQKNEVKNIVFCKKDEVLGNFEGENGHQQPRRCSHCLSQRTPQWRGGPLGPKTLCNACGVRYKSGRLLPEYRPAKSPTFVSYKHSNSHKKVLEMRTMSLSSSSNGD